MRTDANDNGLSTLDLDVNRADETNTMTWLVNNNVTERYKVRFSVRMALMLGGRLKPRVW